MRSGRMITIRRALVAVLAAAVALGAASGTAADRPSVHVLCYHAFLDKKDPFTFSVDDLARHIAYYKEKGFRFITLKQLIDGSVRGNNNILVTIDDGNRSVWEACEKVFKPNRIRPVLGIYPNIINRQSYALTWKQLQQLTRHCDIAAHGWYHLKLNDKLYRERPKDFRREIFESKKVLEEKLGQAVTVFIYPFGIRADVTERLLKEAGYQYAFTIEQGGMELPVQGRYNVLRLPRYMLSKPNWKVCANQIAKNRLYRWPKKTVAARGEEPPAYDRAPGSDMARVRPASSLEAKQKQKRARRDVEERRKSNANS